MKIKITREKVKKEIYEWIKSIIIAFVLAYIIKFTLIESYATPTLSMYPTIQTQDRMMAEKITYRFKKPQRQDIVVFYPPPAANAGNKKYLKRVVAIEGDVIEIKNSKMYLNGKVVFEPYLNEAPYYTLLPTKVPKGHIFVLGDNRNNSADSHIWGTLPEKNVIGRLIFRYWPPSRICIF